MLKLNPIFCCIGSIFSVFSVAVTHASEIKVASDLIVSQDSKHDLSLPLRSMQSKTHGLHHYSGTSLKQRISDLVTPSANALHIPLKGFQGLGVGLGDYQVTNVKPDISASVGMMQYVQWVNSDIAVFDKITGQLAPGFPKTGNAIWSGFGGPCETRNAGSSTVKYDQLAKKWVISQFAYEDINLGPFYQCVAVSISEDAADSYYRYAFQLNSLPHNTRLGLWPDAYYLSMYSISRSITGPQACALERDKMIMGLPAQMQCKQFTAAQSGVLLPADLDGLQLPPVGNPEYFIELDEPNNLVITKFHVDFATPANTTFDTASIPVAPFVESCRGIAGNECAIQPNTVNHLNVYSDRLMSRFVYRQFRDYGSMVATHTIEGVPPKFAPALRWYELRVLLGNPSFNPVLHQQSTLAPDTKNRFLGSIAIDRFTNIAVGYTVTSSLIYPSLEMGTHNYNAPLGTMIIQPLVTGRGSQINGISEWGSTSNMSVDPVDECTFWYTNEYLKTTGSLNWSTYIVKFKLAACD